MASIKLILRTNQKDQTGKSPLYIRIIKDRKKQKLHSDHQQICFGS